MKAGHAKTAPARLGARGDLASFACYALTVAILCLGTIELAYGWFGPPAWRLNTGDLTIYTDATQRVLSGGSWFLERQVHGPYPLAFGDVLYPPVAALFFVPWLVLPGWTFVAIPVLMVGWSVVTSRPAPWAWPLIALCLAWPLGLLKVVSANPNVWVAAFVALGLRYRWPGALVLLKPSFLPLALIGIRSRSWWLTAAALGVLSLPFLGETLMYPRVALNAQGAGLLYSAGDLPTVLIPVVAWWGRRV